MDRYKLTKQDIAEFENRWDETQQEKLGFEYDSDEFWWAQTFFEEGINYARDSLDGVHPNDKASYEQTITELIARIKEKDQEIVGLARDAVLDREKIDALEAEQAVYDEVDDLSLKVNNYKDVIKLLVEMI